MNIKDEEEVTRDFLMIVCLLSKQYDYLATDLVKIMNSPSRKETTQKAVQL
jgi:hypothetical protein